MSGEVATVVVVESADVRAEILPAQGGRVGSLYDRTEQRELLYRRQGAEWDATDYLATLAGGWDQMFPNDDPWEGLQTHGTLWSAELEVARASEQETLLRCALQRPRATVSHRYSLLPPPRRGLLLETVVDMHETLPVCLWATHPMLAVAPGWRVDTGTTTAEADRLDPGRAAPGVVRGEALERVLTMPEPSQGWQEILYTGAAGVASVTGPDGVGTVVRWDSSFFRWLWIVTLSGFESVDLALVLEPCTSRPYRLDEAADAGTAQELASGRTYRFWSSVESIAGS
jgi:hypothetical protein